MADDRKPHPVIDDEPGEEGGSRVVKDHRALQNQSSVSPEDYPQKQRAAQSLVDKNKSAGRAKVNPGPKDSD